MRSAAPKVGFPPPPNINPDSIFLDARLKLYRARQHVNHISKAWEFSLEQYINYVKSAEPNELYTSNEFLFEVRLEAGVILGIGDCIRNLRSVFDYLVSALARKANIPDDQIIFPFNMERAGIENSFDEERAKGRARAFYKLYKNYPDLKKIILELVQPYSKDHGAADSGDLIWRIVTTDNIDKHRLIIPVAQSVSIQKAAFTGGGSISGITFDTGIITNPDGIKVQGDAEMTFDIFFKEYRLARKPVIATLLEGCNVAERVIEIFESHFEGK